MKTELNHTDPVSSEDIAKLLEQIPPVSELDIKRLEDAAKELDNDPAFQAEYLKSLFVEKLLAAMEERNENQNQLAQRWGKTRQYVSKLFNEDKRVNFTLETMAELAHLLGKRLELQVLSPGEASYVMRCTTGMDRFLASEGDWGKIQPNKPHTRLDPAQYGEATTCLENEQSERNENEANLAA